MTSGGAVKKCTRSAIHWTRAASIVHKSLPKMKYHPNAVSQRAFWIPFLTIFLRFCNPATRNRPNATMARSLAKDIRNDSHFPGIFSW